MGDTETATFMLGDVEADVNGRPYVVHDVTITAAALDNGHWIPIDAHATATAVGAKTPRRLHIGLAHPLALRCADALLTQLMGNSEKHGRKNKHKGKKTK